MQREANVTYEALSRHFVVPSFLVVACIASVAVSIAVFGGGEARAAVDTMSEAIRFREAYVDERGIMRWRDDGSEVALFGVNYLLPFGDEYHRTSLLGEDPWTVLERDFSHLERLGVDLIRIHIFDREISDRDGHLVESVHLRLLDRLVQLAERHGIYLFLTPIAWWWTPNQSPGFSTSYPMMEMNVHPDAIKAQEVYLEELLSRVNPLTGRRYADEPHIVAWEIINEPLYDPATTDEQVLAYINRLATSIRRTGTTKPIFYNFWEGKARLAQRSGLDGATFNWYPTGLNAGAGRRENVLPLVERVPWPEYPWAYEGMAKVVYEFDAADILSPLYLPAMALAMRCAGVQMAAQFQYDALSTAPYNAAYATHYLNLAYTPEKAVAFWIAGHVFRSISTVELCADSLFQLVLDPEADLVVLDDGEWFAHTGNTVASPRDRASLRHVYGTGSSPVVRYEGTGAYFFDRMGEGLWSLDLFPDVVALADPHAPGKLDREVGRLISRRQRMAVNLPGLEGGFLVVDATSGRTVARLHGDAEFEIEPGNYWLVADEEAAELGVVEQQRLGRLSRGLVTRPFIPVPEPGSRPPALRHTPPANATAGRPVTLDVVVAADQSPDGVVAVMVDGSGALREIPLERVGAYQYQGDIPAEFVREGILRYWFRVEIDGASHYLPPGAGGTPSSQVSPSDGTPIEAALHGEHSAYRELPGREHILGGGAVDDRFVLDLDLSLISRFAGMTSPGAKGAFRRYVDEPGDRPHLHVYAGGFEYPDGHVNVTLPVPAAPEAGVLVVEMRSARPQTSKVQVVLIDRFGRGFGWNVALSPQWREFRVPIDDLQPVWDGLPGSLNPSQLSQVALIFGSWLYGFDGGAKPHAFDVSRIALERAPVSFEVPLRAETFETRIALFDPAAHPVKLQGVPSRRSAVVEHGGEPVLRMEADGFQEAPAWVYFYHPVHVGIAPDRTRAQDEGIAEPQIEIELRSLNESLKWVEIVLVEKDGAPWGVNIPVSTEWSVVQIAVGDLHYFSHWDHLPAGRGGPSDRLRVENIAAVNFGFGAWLVPGHEAEAHGVELKRISLRLD